MDITLKPLLLQLNCRKRNFWALVSFQRSLLDVNAWFVCKSFRKVPHSEMVCSELYFPVVQGSNMRSHITYIDFESYPVSTDTKTALRRSNISLTSLDMRQDIENEIVLKRSIKRSSIFRNFSSLWYGHSLWKWWTWSRHPILYNRNWTNTG